VLNEREIFEFFSIVEDIQSGRSCGSTSHLDDFEVAPGVKRTDISIGQLYIGSHETASVVNRDTFFPGAENGGRLRDVVIAIHEILLEVARSEKGMEFMAYTGNGRKIWPGVMEGLNLSKYTASKTIEFREGRALIKAHPLSVDEGRRGVVEIEFGGLKPAREELATALILSRRTLAEFGKRVKS